MAIKTYKPTSPSRRNMTGINYREVITTNKPHKALTYGRKRHVGRNNNGRITAPHKGGGHKRLYREIDFKLNKINIPAKLKQLNTIQTEQLSSHLFVMQMVNDDMLYYHKVLKLALVSLHQLMLRLQLETDYHYHLFL